MVDFGNEKFSKDWRHSLIKSWLWIVSWRKLNIKIEILL